MPDVLYKGRLEGLHIAFSYAVTTDMVGEAVRRHDCDPVAAHLLGRAMTAGLMSSATISRGERLNIRWAYTGKLRTIVVDTGPDGATRAFITPSTLADAEDINALLGGDGSVQVIRSRDGVVTSSGTTKAELQDVVEDLAYSMCISDQIETGALAMIAMNPDPENPVKLCRGVLIQALPNSSLEQFSRVRDRLRDNHVRALLARDGESDNLFENILNDLVKPEGVAPRLVFDACPTPVFKCNCSREKMGAVLRSLPYGERMDMVKKAENVVVSCRFCNTKYELTIDECVKAWNEKPA